MGLFDFIKRLFQSAAFDTQPSGRLRPTVQVRRLRRQLRVAPHAGRPRPPKRKRSTSTPPQFAPISSNDALAAGPGIDTRCARIPGGAGSTRSRPPATSARC